jgi:hypothetical protein
MLELRLRLLIADTHRRDAEARRDRAPTPYSRIRRGITRPKTLGQRPAMLRGHQRVRRSEQTLGDLHEVQADNKISDTPRLVLSMGYCYHMLGKHSQAVNAMQWGEFLPWALTQ